MIRRRDLELIPLDDAHRYLSAARAAACEGLAGELSVHSLDRVMKVVLRLMALASCSAPARRTILLELADELDAAVRAAREVLVGVAPSNPRTPGSTSDAVEIALLDTTGVILWTNRAWDEFCRANGGDPRRCGVGRSYLALCDAADDRSSAEVARAIREAVRGDLPAPARTVVPCPAPDRPRTFDVLVSSRRGDDGQVIGATVTLSELTGGEGAAAAPGADEQPAHP